MTAILVRTGSRSEEGLRRVGGIEIRFGRDKDLRWDEGLGAIAEGGWDGRYSGGRMPFGFRYTFAMRCGKVGGPFPEKRLEKL